MAKSTDIKSAPPRAREKSLHFGVDGFFITQRPWANSVNHFVGQILRHMKPEKWNARVTCFTRASIHPIPEILEQSPVEWIQPFGKRLLWRHFALPLTLRKAQVDAMWFPFTAIPFVIGKPSAITVHDISFIELPHLFDWRSRLYLGSMLRHSLAKASQIITISQFTADALVRAFGISASRITIIHHGASPPPTTRQPHLAVPIAGVDAQAPHFLFLDGANPRKNLQLLTSFLRQAPPRWLLQTRIVITGNAAAVKRLLREHGVADLIGTRIIVPGILPQVELDCLYRTASALLYLSEYEGFGIPILEAYASDCPVIALRATSLPEVAGNAALFVDPGNIAQLESAMRATLDQTTRSEMIAAGRQRLREFSWANAADRLCETLVKTAKQG